MVINNYLELLGKNRTPVRVLDEFYVYALWNKGEIVYVGQTTALAGRIKTHRKNKLFDEYSFFECRSKDEMDEAESELILTLQTKYNKAIGNKHISIDAVRKSIRELSKHCKYSKEYYIGSLKKKIIDMDITVYDGINHSYIRVDDLQTVIERVKEIEGIN